MIRRISIASLLPFLMIMAPTPALTHPLGGPTEGYNQGDTVPFDALDLIDGKKLDLKGLRANGHVVLTFWSYYFTDYKRSLDCAARLFREFSGRGVSFFSVNLDSDEAKAKAILTASGMGGGSTYNPFLNFPAKLLGSIAPDSASLLIIDKDGKVAFMWRLANEADLTQSRDFLDKAAARPKSGGTKKR